VMETLIRRGARVLRTIALCPLAAVWTELAIRGLRRDLAEKRVGSHVPPQLIVSSASMTMATLWLRLRRATCLERSLVLQRWLFAAGQPHDVLIGVSPTEGSVEAHAWLDYEAASGFTVIARMNPLHGR
jgi:hypothetical protein